MRIVVTGAGGMLGTDVVQVLKEHGHAVRGLTRAELDITDTVAVFESVAECEVLVNCAAWTAVDDAEAQEQEAFTLNAVAPQLLARAANAVGASVVQVSTDYVFDGVSNTPYSENAALAPRSAYGRTKAAGEWAVRSENSRHWIVRTAWLYGESGGCFPRTIAGVAEGRDEITVVDDQIGQPTWTRDVAIQIAALIESEAPFGTYHATSSGSASWYDFAKVVLDTAQITTRVRPVTSEAFQRPAPRPAWSVLGHQAWHDAGIEPIGAWQDRWSTIGASIVADR